MLVRFLTALTLGIVLPLVVQRLWWARLSPERRRTGWNGASWAAALYAFGPLSMIAFAWVTRRRPGAGWAVLSLVAGLAWAYACARCIEYVDLGLEALLGVESSPF